jgi:hypothetical protein
LVRNITNYLFISLYLVDTSYAGRGIVDIRVINKDKSVAIQKVETEQQCVYKFAFLPEDASVYQGNRN